MKPWRRSFVAFLAVAAVSVAAGAAWFVLGRSSSDSGNLRSESVSSSVPFPDWWSLSSGTEFRFQYTLSSKGKVDVSTQASRGTVPSELSSRVSGLLKLRIQESENSLVRVFFQMPDPQGELTVERTSYPLSGVDSPVGSASLSRTEGVVAIDIVNEANVILANALKTMLSLTIVPKPDVEFAKSVSWKFTSQSPYGAIENSASIVWTGDSLDDAIAAAKLDPGQELSRKAPLGESGFVVLSRKVSSADFNGETIVLVDRRLGVPLAASFQGVQSQTTGIGTSRTDLTFQLALHDVGRATTPAATPAAASAGQANAAQTSPPPSSVLATTKTSQGDTERRFLNETLGDDTAASVAQAVTDLERRSAGARGNGDEVTTLYLKFKALVQRGGKDAEEVAFYLERAPADSLLFELSAGALSAIETDDAQRVFLEAVKRRENDADALRLLLPLLTNGKSPSENSLAFVQEIANGNRGELSRIAQLGLGVSARTLQNTKPEFSTAFARSAAAGLREAQNERAQLHWLEVVGNSGAYAAWNDVASLQGSSSPAVRGQAVLSMRFMQGEGVDKAIVRGLSDSDVTVRTRAIETLGFRKTIASIENQVADFVVHEPEESLRLRMIRTLAAAPRPSPVVRAAIETLSANDSSAAVRSQAASALAVW